MRTRRTWLPSGRLSVLCIAATAAAAAQAQSPEPVLSPYTGAFPYSVSSGASPLVKSVAAAQADKEGRILLSGFRVADGLQNSTGVMLSAPPVSSDPSVYFADPTVRDEVKVHLAPEVVARLKNLGIGDVSAHFKGKTLQVRGKRRQATYLCFPAVIVYTLSVERLEDILATSSGVADRALTEPFVP